MGMRGTLCHDIFCPVPFPCPLLTFTDFCSSHLRDLRDTTRELPLEAQKKGTKCQATSKNPKGLARRLAGPLLLEKSTIKRGKQRRRYNPPPQKKNHEYLGARQRSGEGVVRRNGCPKGCFWRVCFYSSPLRFSGPFRYFKNRP